jgi:rhodanese-related sulfurtransferase
MPKKHHSSNSSKTTRSGSSRRRQGRDQHHNLIAVWIGIGLVVIFAAAVLLLRRGPAAPPEITVAQAFEKFQAGALFVDVRTQKEWDQGHIARSILIPLEELPNRINDLPKDRDIVVICRSGVRSKQGAAILLDAGYNRVTCMNGGIQAWVSAGYPVEQ